MLEDLNQPKKTAKPFFFVFALDDSGSMAGQAWNDLIGGVSAFIRNRIQFCAEKGTKALDLVTIINYSNSAQVMCQGVSIHSSPETKTRFRNGGTDFQVALKMSHTELQRIDQKQYSPVLIFMSDGGCSNGDQEMKAIISSMPQVAVRTIGFGRKCDQNRMNQLALLGKGEFFFGADGVTLQSEFESMSDLLSSNQPCY